MREYATPAGFRAAVDAILRQRARDRGVPAYVVRRQAGLERLALRLMTVAPGRWALKGGFALETRLGEHARVSVDLDADHLGGAEAARADLQRAIVAEVGDHFGFALIGAEELRSGGVGLAVRYRLESSVAGRPFEPLQVDVSLTAPDPWDAQRATRTGLLIGVGLGPMEVWLVPLERQVAEKLHACTRTYETGGTTRARDLVDLLLIHEHERLDVVALQGAIWRVFHRRATHAIPGHLPPPPRALAVGYRREAGQVGVLPELMHAHRLLADWLDPVLTALADARPAGPAGGQRLP
jgi:hypothetical protein